MKLKQFPSVSFDGQHAKNKIRMIHAMFREPKI
jgi:hypothetical protein